MLFHFYSLFARFSQNKLSVDKETTPFLKTPVDAVVQGPARSLPKEVDISQYVGGGIVVFNLRTRNLRWQQHLDLSTDHTQYRAYIYSAPTLVDLNRDGKMEIIVGTSMVRHSSSSSTQPQH